MNQSREHKRLLKELKDIETGAANGSDVTAKQIDGNMFHWKGYIKGPEHTPFDGGLFIIDIIIPPEYPYNPPKMKFDTKIWHPNMSSQTGAICLDILKDEWSPALTIRTALLSIQALLSAPVPESPQDNEVATMYKTSIEEYNAKAREWTQTFATADQESKEEKLVNQLSEMGFDFEKSRQTLMRNHWNMEAALAELLG
eukprot:GDKJ01052522.1.p1 GENE.GDKJ01052522.1~~GDKJ01052522.1.p1  ORF type:complete len:199 (+),score=53.14 GDKJ01052522.1:37-633(+)